MKHRVDHDSLTQAFCFSQEDIASSVKPLLKQESELQFIRDRHTRLLAIKQSAQLALSKAAEFGCRTEPVGHGPDTSSDCRESSAVYSALEKYYFANLARDRTTHAAVKAAAAWAASHGLPAPDKSSLSRWFSTVKKLEDDISAAMKKHAGFAPAAEVMKTLVIAGLENKRSSSGRHVPQDVFDSVDQFVSLLEELEMSFTRNDVRMEFLSTMQKLHPHLCADHPGGWFTASDDFMRSWEERRASVRRGVTTGGRSWEFPESMDAATIRHIFHMRLASIVFEYDGVNGIPKELVVGADETGVHLIPSSASDVAVKDSKQVAGRGVEGKRQISALVRHTMAGEMLPLQLIFQGQSDRVLPKLSPAEIEQHSPLLSHSHNAWSDEATTIKWFQVVPVPFLLRKKASLGLPSDSPSVLVWDVHWSHRHRSTREYIADNVPWLRLLYVPVNATSFLQVCDASINKPLKTTVQSLLRRWRLDEIKETGTLARGVKHLRLQVSRAILQASKSIPKEVVLHGVQAVGLDRVWSPAVRDDLLESAHELAKAGTLWVALSRGDVATEGGRAERAVFFGPEEPSRAEAAHASRESSDPPTPPPTGGKKRTRTYTCGFCKNKGHRSDSCPAARSGARPHPDAKAAVRARYK